MNLKNKKKDVKRRQPNLAQDKLSVFSYHAKRASSPDNKGGKASLHRQVWKLLPSFVGMLAILFSLLYLISIEGKVAVSLVSQTDGSNALMREIEVYEQGATKIMGESIFFGNKVTFNDSRLEDRLLSEFPELSSISVSLGLFSRMPVVTAVVRAPAFYVTDLKDQTFLVDINGVVTLPIAQTASQLRRNLPKVVDMGSIELNIGDTVLSASETQFIGSLAELLEKTNQSVESFTLTTNAYELHLNLENHNYFVKFNTLENVRTQVGTLLATQSYLDKENHTPEEYVDVRVEGRVFYN